MIKEGVKKSTYKKTKDATLQDLKKFQDFLCRKLYTYKHYQSMYPHSNQPAKSCRTAKGHKSNHTKSNSALLWTKQEHSYNTSQVISQYLKPLCKNEFIINDT